MTIGIAIVGLGSIGFGCAGENQANNPTQSHTFATLNNKNCRLILGVDTDSARRSRFEKTTRVTSFRSITEVDLATISRVDAFIVAVPTTQHFSILRQISSVKKDFWVLCEKPMGSNYEDMLSLDKLMDPRNIIINYSRRFSSDVQGCKTHFRSLINHSKSKFRVNFHGGLLRTGSHFIDLANFWFWDDNKLALSEMISETKDGYLIRYPNVGVEFVSVNPNSEESFAEFLAESELMRICINRDEFTKSSPSGIVTQKIHVSQENAIRALVDLVFSDGEINACSYLDAIRVHHAMSCMKNFHIH